MSDLAKTVQRPAIRAGLREARASAANSPSMRMPSRSACWSRNEPVPAAQRAFMAKSTSTIWPLVASHSTERNLLSWPPISITVRASGWKSPTARVCVTSSFAWMPPTRSATAPPPEPVRPAATTRAPWNCPSRRRLAARRVSRGWPFDLT